MAIVLVKAFASGEQFFRQMTALGMGETLFAHGKTISVTRPCPPQCPVYPKAGVAIEG
jgi:hypothetical protein